MPCSSSEGQGSPSAVAGDALDEVRRLRKVLDDHADSLCMLRQVVVMLLHKVVVDAASPSATSEELAAMERLIRREAAHAEWDRQQGRR